MRMLMIPTVAAFMAASPLALAQSATDTQPADQSAASSSASSSGASGQASQGGARGIEEVRSSLEQAGIENVKVLNAAYLVRARSKDGEQVSFLIEPPVGGQMGGQAGGQAGGQTGGQASAPGGQMAGSQENVRQALQDAGFTDIRFAEASYLAQGQTKDGDQITMMIDASTSGQAASGATGAGATGGTSGGQPAPAD